MPAPETIGLIGAGLLGTALADRLFAAGFRVLVWDRDAARLEALTRMGAGPATDAATIAARCGRILFSLPDSNVVSAVLAELEEHLHEGHVIIDTSTGEPAHSLRFATTLAARGVTY